MSTPINDGGPAYPVIGMPLDPDTILNRSGMSLRDYFAAKSDIPWEVIVKAMTEIYPSLNDVIKARAEMKYAEADAMLSARLRQK